MILAEPFRFAPLNLEKGMIVVNEDCQKFKVRLNSSKVIALEPYEGKSKPVMFVFLGPLPSATE